MDVEYFVRIAFGGGFGMPGVGSVRFVIILGLAVTGLFLVIGGPTRRQRWLGVASLLTAIAFVLATTVNRITFTFTESGGP
jgi:uncharacterized BrkB/YihY/UPF0761 family membrane protein